MTVYDTLDHQIGGVSQQQSGDASFTFVSQRGLVRLADLPVVSARTGTLAPSRRLHAEPPAEEPTQVAGSAPAQPAPDRPQQPTPAERQSDDIFAKIERLPIFMQRVFSDEEFAAKKTELLSRL